MSLIKHLLAKPRSLSRDGKYTILNGVAYLAVGTLLVVWPGVTQTVFRDAAFAGHEEALMRVIGLTVAVIGWLYIFGGRSGARQFVAASVVDRLVFVPFSADTLGDSGRVPPPLHNVRAIGRLPRHRGVGADWLRIDVRNGSLANRSAAASGGVRHCGNRLAWALPQA